MIIHRYILRNHIVPFLLSVFVLISVFLLQFLMKFADQLIGKGLSAWVIIKLISYNLAWMVVLVVPMAVLIATLMAFGTMSQNNEVAILRASGMSLYKMIIAPLIGAVLIAYLLIQFNNEVYPDANHAARILMQDITRKKPTLSLVPGVFSQEVPNYSLLARKIDPISNELQDLTIYDYSDHGSINIITANRGVIYFSRDREKLILDLWEGEIHTSDMFERDDYRKIHFNKHKIGMPGSQFLFRQSALGGERGDRELGAAEMKSIIDSLMVTRATYNERLSKSLADHFSADTVRFRFSGRNPSRDLITAYIRAENQLKSVRNIVLADIQRLEDNQTLINSYWVEIHKKYSIPVACIVFILIGAPLGTMTRKGGIGVAAGVSMLFFLVYWAFLIGGEKLADRALLSPFWGMWGANFFLGGLGILLMIKSARERTTISFDFLIKLVPKKLRQISDNYENS